MIEVLISNKNISENIRNLEATILYQRWKNNLEHQEAQAEGQKRWYKHYKVRIAKVERDYEFLKK